MELCAITVTKIRGYYTTMEADWIILRFELARELNARSSSRSRYLINDTDRRNYAQIK